MGKDDGVVSGSVTVLVNVATGVLTLIGVIVAIVPLGELFCHRHEDVIKLSGKVTEEEQFAIIDVTNAILPPGFPLTIAQLTASSVAVNVDDIILITPVEVV